MTHTCKTHRYGCNIFTEFYEQNFVILMRTMAPVMRANSNANNPDKICIKRINKKKRHNNLSSNFQTYSVANIINKFQNICVKLVKLHKIFIFFEKKNKHFNKITIKIA